MTSPPSILDRFGSPRAGASFLYPRHSPHRSPSEYVMEELEPRPADSPPTHQLPSGRLKSAGMAAADLPPPTDSWNDWGSSTSSRSSLRGKSRAMFAGPPPPIAPSMMLSRHGARPPQDSASSSPSRPSKERTGQRSNSGRTSRVLFDHNEPVAPRNTDSVWRGLQRQERALEEEVQQFLDLQAAGLVAGSGNVMHADNKSSEGFSDSGSSTPTGTFYSTATSKSRMVNSLYVPSRATPDGNVIPVRQPTKGRPTGLRAAREGLHGSMEALAELKREEDAYIDAGLSQRKKALVHLSRLSVRKDGISAELHVLEEDQGEPLGQELRELGTKYDSITQEIRSLEEKLVGMRNRRRWLKEKMDDVRNKREAGLSGYRGALKDVDSEVASILRQPPVRPLDPDMTLKADGAEDLPPRSSGVEFLQLLPERRTIDMARAWWEDEISLLERRKTQITKERQALEEGSAVWQDVMRLVTDFESNLRQLVKGRSVSRDSTNDNLPPEETAREHTAKMGAVVQELERCMEMAEAKHWNLLICAIGAELEAFKEAQTMLQAVFAPTKDEPTQSAEKDVGELSLTDKQRGKEPSTGQEQPDDSDNEVPPDLLVSHYEDHTHGQQASPRPQSVAQSDTSSNEVPPEFLDGKSSPGKGHREEQ